MLKYLHTSRGRIEGVEIELRTLLPSALEGGDWWDSRLGHFAPGKGNPILIGQENEWCSRFQLDDLEEKKNPFFLFEFQLRIVQPVAETLKRTAN